MEEAECVKIIGFIYAFEFLFSGSYTFDGLGLRKITKNKENRQHQTNRGVEKVFGERHFHIDQAEAGEDHHGDHFLHDL